MGEAVDGPELRAVEEGLGDEGEVVVLLRGVARPAEPSVKLAPCCFQDISWGGKFRSQDGGAR